VENYTDHNGKSIDVEVFDPDLGSDAPCVVVLHGTRGLHPPFGESIRDLARAIKSIGIVAVIPHYLQTTDTSAATDIKGDFVVTADFARHQGKWIQSIASCIEDLQSRPSITAGRIGLLGLSMGGHIALQLSKLAGGPDISAVVEFFAPIRHAVFEIGSNISDIPPVHIHHGLADSVVHPEQSEILVDLLRQEGKTLDIDYKYWKYPGEQHGFQTQKAIDDSTSRTVAFFKSHLVQ
jgi:dienelactone hydrolase